MLREKKAGMVHFTKVLPVFHAAINFPFACLSRQLNS